MKKMMISSFLLLFLKQASQSSSQDLKLEDFQFLLLSSLDRQRQRKMQATMLCLDNRSSRTKMMVLMKKLPRMFLIRKLKMLRKTEDHMTRILKKKKHKRRKHKNQENVLLKTLLLQMKNSSQKLKKNQSQSSSLGSKLADWANLQ